MKWRRAKKAVLLVGCVVPPFSLICGDELAKPKYRKRKR